MANALNWLVLFCSLRSFLRGSSSLSPDCSIDCQSHCLIDCRQGHYYTAGNCLECPVGFYCPGGQAAPRKCPLGTANGLTGQGASTACQVCPRGYVSLESGAGCRACPQGSRCDPGSGVSRSCQPGQHSPEGELDCGECPEGYICPDGHSRQRCGAGQQPDPSHTHCVTFSPGPGSGEDTLQCQPCPAGHFCSDGLAVPPCPAGSFKPREELHTLSSSSLCLPGIGLCLKCPAGYFCPAGASFPAPCQPGTYNPLQGQDEAADCTACPAGRACTQAGLAQPDAECLPGYVCPVGSASPHHPSNACPPGTIGNDFNLFDKSQCETCPAGFVCGRGTGGKQKPPTPCPVGHYCPPGTKHPLQHKCPPGTWSNRTSLSSEEQCFPCPAGWFCVGGARSPTGMCSSGHYCPQGTWRATQYPCPAGTYNTRLGSGRVEDCAACPAGAFCTSGTSKPVLCPVGTYRGEGGAEVAADCIPCPGGYHCPQLGTVAPQTCGAGNFSDQGAASCLPCLVGHYCAGEHTSREVMLLAMACPAGLLCPEGQAAVPDASANACPRGYYCPQGDHSLHAKPCPNGTYGEQRGLSSAAECSPCPVGKYCYRGGMEASGIPHPTGDCPPGYNCPLGTGFPFSFPCMPGFWDNSSTEEADTCQPCPRGFYCDSPAMSEPKACPAGFYCVEGSSKPEPCPEGTYSNKKGLSAPSECSPCDHGFYCAAPGQTGPSGPCKAGFYCQGRALTPLPTDGVTGDVCPAGAYCPPGSPLPIPCPPGTYSNLSGLRSLRECLDCPPGLYCDGTNSQAPSGPCEPGYFCPGGARSALQQVVMEGHYSLAGAFKPEPCPLGSFQPDRGQSLCRDCPEGTFCNQTGLAAPQDCPKGHFCLAGSSLPTPCPVGTYRDVVRAGSCRLCPAGMYCSMAALPEPEGHCQPGHYCSQGSTTSSPMGLPFGDLCPRGHYCPAGTTHPRERPCPAGTWNGQRGAQDASWCLPCAPGFFCNMSGQDAPAGLCARGYYCTGRTKTAKPEDGSTGDLCPRGHFCPAGSAAPSPCPTGEYSNATGQDRCFPCPAGFHCSKGLRHRCPPGFYCPQRTGISFYPCPPGTYNPSYGLSQAERCQQCPAGMFCGEWGLSSPSGPCWPGFFCTAGASVPNPTGATNTSTGGPCPPGHFCPVGTSVPQQCPVGTYSDRLYNQQDSSCTACPAGYYCSSAGLTAPSGPCSAGYYCLSGASLPSPSGMWERGGPCPVSHFCPEGSSFPLPCLAGTYNNLTRQAGCFPCAAGYYCPENTTSYHQNPCPAGFYCPKGTRFATEFPCPRGYYNPDAMTQSLDSCLPCPPGHYCGKENLTAPSGQCDAGWFCISAAWTSRPFDLDNYTNANCLCPATATGGKCIPGFYCPRGSPEPLSCPPGLYCNASGLAVPSGECTAGFYCKGGAALPKPTDGVTGNICPVGAYCTAASAVPKLCPAGTFSSLLGRRSLSECQPCPSGFYCEVPGLSAPTGECWEGYYCDNQQGPLIDFTLYPCPQGFYCPPGTNRSTQYSCPAGTFGARPKLKTAKECQRCPPGKYCEFSGLAAPTGDCAEGFWCKSGARVRNPQDGESGIPCPPGHYCPEGAPLPLQCPPGTWAGSEGSGSLQECQPCPGGYYCNSSGQRAPSGHCSPGYYCITRAQSPTPTDGLSGAPCPLSHFCPLGSGSPAPCPPGSYMPHTRGEKCHACPEGEYCASGEKPQPCPQGCFCPKGTALPIACPAGSYNPSERQASCLPCPPGFFCPKNSSSFLENECPAGHYCPPGTASATQFPCPKGTYNPQTGSSLMSHCTPCDPGHYCARVGQSEVTGPCWAGFYCSRGVSTPAPTDGLLGNSCPRGAYCPGGSASPQPCPPGYYSNSTGNTGLEDCLLCDAGYFCNASGLVSPTGLCEAGFYCSGGSISPKPPRTTVSGGPCPPGHYCVVGSSRAQPCPAGSYSPSWSMAQCLECPEGFYCTTGSTDYMDCPAGHYCPRNTEFATQYPCPPGTYSEALNIWDASKCQLCPPGRVCSKPGLTRPDGSCLPGWFCPPGSTASKPMVPGNDSGSYHEKPCPSGHYCPPLASAPLPCPPGTYGSSSFAKHIEDCQACPAGTFNHLPAQAACFPCGSSSSSQPGAASCACHGLNRAFQPSDASCICRAGFVHYDERGKKAPDSNSDQDCQPQVDELCAPGEIRLSATRRCVSPERYDCSPSCGAAGGEISAELGICHCKQYVSAEELCDQLCLLRAPLISLAFGINRELLLRVNEGEVREVTNVLGPDEHVQKSQRVHLVLFSPSGVLGFIVSSVDVLDIFLRGVFSSDQLLQKGRRAQRTSTKDIQALPLIPNPVVCLEAGDTILFQLSINSHDRASSHYPVYQKQHLYNSNPGWDFGPFRRLDHLIQETHLNISWFAHVFLDSGTYVFRDRTIQEHFLIVTVNEANVGCDPRDVSFQPSSLFQLARRGVVKKQELNLAPNWAAITAVLFVLGFLVVMLATLAIVFQPAAPISSPMKSWKPRWRSLGEPHIPPEYILLKDSLQFYQMVGPHGSGEDAGSEEKGAAQNTGEQPVLRVLEDFSVRTLYDKLEDQNLHLAAQLAKHRVDVMVFYNGIRQQVQSLMDMVQGLDSESLKILAKQRVSGQKPAESSWAAADVEPCGELCSNNLQTGSLGAPWQEAMELMKALEMLLGKALHKNIAVKEEMEQKGQAQDAVAVVPPLHSLATESKSAAVEGQDLELPQQHELFSQNDAFFSFPGHKEQGSDLQLAYLSELEVEGLMAASPLAKTLCDIKQSLVTLQQPSDLVHPDNEKSLFNSQCKVQLLLESIKAVAVRWKLWDMKLPKKLVSHHC